LEWSKVIEWLKPTPKLFFAIAIGCALLLFAPESTLEPLGLLKFREEKRLLLGSGLVLGSVLLLAEAMASIGSWLRGWVQYRRLIHNGIKRLHDLTPAEQNILALYLTNNTRSQFLQFNDGVAEGLETCWIIRRASQISEGFYFPYNIQPWAWKYLKKHPELVGLRSPFRGSSE
jgi:Super-infection exclusion protein B